jgi:hypothetical protein
MVARSQTFQVHGEALMELDCDGHAGLSASSLAYIGTVSDQRSEL